MTSSNEYEKVSKVARFCGPWCVLGTDWRTQSEVRCGTGGGSLMTVCSAVRRGRRSTDAAAVHTGGRRVWHSAAVMSSSSSIVHRRWSWRPSRSTTQCLSVSVEETWWQLWWCQSRRLSDVLSLHELFWRELRRERLPGTHWRHLPRSAGTPRWPPVWHTDLSTRSVLSPLQLRSTASAPCQRQVQEILAFRARPNKIVNRPPFFRGKFCQIPRQFMKFCEIPWHYYSQIPYISRPLGVVVLTDSTSKYKEFIVTCNTKTHYFRPLMMKISSKIMMMF